MLRPHINLIRVNGHVEDSGPALECGDDEEGEHGVQHVVVVKVASLPDTFFNHGLTTVVVVEVYKAPLKKNRLINLKSFIKKSS